MKGKKNSESDHRVHLTSLGQFASGVGHEINNPLNIINGFLTMITQRLHETNYSDPLVFEKLESITLANKRISTIVKALREFSNENSQVVADLNLHDLVFEVFVMIRDLYRRSSIEVEFECENKSIKVWGNKERLQKALISLLSNAKDALNDVKAAKVTILIEETEREIKIIITDNGVGIAEELKEKVFNPFFTTKDVNKRIGIGLTLAHAIAVEHGGRIELDSKAEIGTKIIMLLPIFNIN